MLVAHHHAAASGGDGGDDAEQRDHGGHRHVTVHEIVVTGEQLGIELPEGEYVTLGGYLFDVFGHIPEEGEKVPFAGWEFRVAEMDKRRVAKVVVQAAEGTPTIGGPTDS